MKREFKCEYCGKIFSDPVPHKCIGGFRKHHLKFINLHPTNKEQIRKYKDEIGIPRNLNTFELVDYLANNYKLFVAVVPARSVGGGWLENVIDLGFERRGTITQDSQIYEKYEEALEVSIIEALAYLSTKRRDLGLEKN